ncbi:MAG: D-glycero-beta-D-manno-heptose 1,7-bisphosphate 7-phosphatase [Pseudomonadota bacterium]
MSSVDRWLILDRDGVINVDSDRYVRSVAEWQPIPGSIDAIAAFSKAGWVVTVATNQSGIGRGYFSRQTLYGMHAKLRKLVRRAGGDVAEIAFCPHTPEDNCDCRKPKPGLLHQLAKRTGLQLKNAVLVGDSERDLEAGNAVGAELWLVRSGKGQKTETALQRSQPAWATNVNVRDNLSGVAQSLLRGVYA